MSISGISSAGAQPIGNIADIGSVVDNSVTQTAVPNLTGTKPTADGFSRSFHYNEVVDQQVKKPSLIGRLRNAVGGGVKNVKKGGAWVWNKTLGGLGNNLNERAQNHFVNTGKKPFFNPFYKPSEAVQQVRWLNTQGMNHLNKAATLGSAGAGAAVGWNVGPTIGEKFFGSADVGKWRLFGAAGGAAGGVGVKQGVQHLWGNEIATFVRNFGSRLILRK